MGISYCKAMSNIIGHPCKARISALGRPRVCAMDIVRDAILHAGIEECLGSAGWVRPAPPLQSGCGRQSTAPAWKLSWLPHTDCQRLMCITREDNTASGCKRPMSWFNNWGSVKWTLGLAACIYHRISCCGHRLMGHRPATLWGAFNCSLMEILRPFPNTCLQMQTVHVEKMTGS